MIKALSSIGYEVEIIKEKKGLDARRISALRFNFKEIKQDAVKEIKPATPLELKQDAAMISMGKIKEIKTPTPFKENDALIRFRNSVKQKRHL
ncbi:hypothetical protein [Helicobacter pylori]|uniref:hypothetical protein n=1 Tax=Helicobacter pylori TaxID=210 RepID=UPI002FC80174